MVGVWGEGAKVTTGRVYGGSQLWRQFQGGKVKSDGSDQQSGTVACIPLKSAFASADFRVANAEKGAQTM